MRLNSIYVHVVPDDRVHRCEGKYGKAHNVSIMPEK
jgi:hypothetical protein